MYDGNQGEIDFGSSQREVWVIGSQLYCDLTPYSSYSPAILFFVKNQFIITDNPLNHKNLRAAILVTNVRNL